MSNVLDHGERISFSEFVNVWIPILKIDNKNTSIYSVDEWGKAYYVSGNPWFKTLGLFDDVDIPEFLKSSTSIRLK